MSSPETNNDATVNERSICEINEENKCSINTDVCVNRILLIGQIGIGKGSVINLLTDAKLAVETDQAKKGNTDDLSVYRCEYNNEIYEFISTIGINDNADCQTVLKQIERYNQVAENSLNALLFIISKGVLTKEFETNYKYFRSNNRIPALLYIGHCEDDEPMSKWIRTEENMRLLKMYKFNDIICGTAKRGRRHEDILRELREETKKSLWSAIEKNKSKEIVNLSTSHVITSSNEIDKANRNRLLIFGQGGSGKSNLISLLADAPFTPNNHNATSDTTEFHVHQLTRSDITFEIIEHSGVDETSSQTDRERFVELLRYGFNCVLFILNKGRLTDAFERNHKLFKYLCKDKSIPIILYVSHCEDDHPMNKWIQRQENSESLQLYNFDAIVCGTTLYGSRHEDILRELRDETQKQLWESIIKHMTKEPVLINNKIEKYVESFCRELKKKSEELYRNNNCS